jgi:hypothetical protein
VCTASLLAFAVLQGALVTCQAEPPAESPNTVAITHVPPAGAGPDTWGTISGNATGADLNDCRIVVFARGDVWYVQPQADKPYTTLQAGGHWETGTHLGYEYAALLVKLDYVPPATVTDLPSVGGGVLAIVSASPAGGSPARTITFSGYDWVVKSSAGPVGPGPNLFSDSAESVFVDDQGRLHLRILEEAGKWTCAEVVSKRSFSYGTYRFHLATPVDDLDPNVVLGMFTWSDDPAFAHREIDIECARWGKANDPTNAQFVVQPYVPAGHLLRFSIPLGQPHTVQVFIWCPDQVIFESLLGAQSTDAQPPAVAREWKFNGQGVPQAGGENARINLWLNGGVPPARGQNVEVIVRKFEFSPLQNH